MHTCSRTLNVQPSPQGMVSACAGVYAAVFAYVGYWFSYGVPMADR